MAEFSDEQKKQLGKAIESALSGAFKGIGKKIFEDITEEAKKSSDEITKEFTNAFNESRTGKITSNLDKIIGKGSGLNKSFSTLNLVLKGTQVGFTAVAAAAVQLGLAGDKQITELAKTMTLTKMEAMGARYELLGMSAATGDAFITGEKLLQSTTQLQKQLGIAQMFSSGITVEFTNLTEKIGLSAESAANLSKISIMTGKNARVITTEALGTAQALQAQAGIQLNNKDILEEVGKVTGQLLANFKGNTNAIASAVTQAKLLGTTLEQTKKQSESLLNFESSISNELKAELLTGQQLNLERARGAALIGDQETVMKELANQNMNFNKFSQMNVIAQNSLAGALGLSSDELANQLATIQFQGKSRQQVVALAGEEVAKRLEALDAQTKFNNTVEKLKDTFVKIMDGPVGAFLDLLASFSNSATGAAVAFGASTLTPSSNLSLNSPSNTVVKPFDEEKLGRILRETPVKVDLNLTEFNRKQAQMVRLSQ